MSSQPPPWPPAPPTALEPRSLPPGYAWGPPPRVPWNLGDVFKGLLVPLAFYAVAVTARRLVGDPRGVTASGDGIRLLASLLILAFQFSLLLPLWWFGLRKYNVGPSALGLRGFSALPGCGLMIVTLVVGYMFTGAWGLFLARYGLRAQPNPLPIFGEGIAGLLVALLAAGVVAPLTEEMFFRGFMFPAFRDRLGEAGGIAASAAVFAVAHWQPLALPALFALGALLAWLYQKTGSLWPGIVLHATINSVAILTLFAVGDQIR